MNQNAQRQRSEQPCTRRTSRLATLTALLAVTAISATGCASWFKSRAAKEPRVLIVGENDSCEFIESGDDKGKWLCGSQWMAENARMNEELLGELEYWMKEKRCEKRD